MHIIREKTDCNQKMNYGYLVPPKVWRTFFFYCSPRLIPIKESMKKKYWFGGGHETAAAAEKKMH